MATENHDEKIFFDDIQDYLLLKLSIPDLLLMKDDIDAEIAMRKSLASRKIKYFNELAKLKEEHLKNKQDEINKLKEELEESKNKIRRQQLKEDIRDEEDSNEESEEIPIVKPKRGRKKK
jgi:hypothetical protein